LPGTSTASADLVRALPLDLWFDTLAMRLDGRRAAGLRLRIGWHFSDSGERVLLNLENCALTHRLGVHDDGADAQISLTRATLDEITLQRSSFPAEVQAGRVKVEGRVAALVELMGLLDRFDKVFAVVGPRPFPDA
ncbi:MAG TPA: alkyl sulfatase C-terminal domain-containing protein, partial [Rubrivivax sp.]|nr:alkyl sulfatase C-terminal domain-containing protein [Rubrivivax sp.]